MMHVGHRDLWERRWDHKEGEKRKTSRGRICYTIEIRVKRAFRENWREMKLKHLKPPGGTEKMHQVYFTTNEPF